MQSTSFISMKLEFSGRIFEKFSGIKFHKNPSSGTEFFHGDGRTVQRRTDRHDEANSQFSQFFKST